MCKVEFITQFGLIMEYCRENCVHSRERMLLISLFHCANRVAQQSSNHDWPDGYFTVSNAELNSWCDLDKKTIETLRNSLRQRGLIDFIKGQRNKSQPSYKLNYLVRDGYRIVPYNQAGGCVESKIVPNKSPNKSPNNPPNIPPFSIDIDTEIDTGIDTENTHKGVQQTDARGSGREAAPSARYDPENPTEDDRGWMTSARARGAIAQKLLDHHMPDLKPGMYVLSDNVTLKDNDGFEVLCRAMEARITPKTISELAGESEEAWEWLARVRWAATLTGNAPQEWNDIRWEIAEALKEIQEERERA